MCRPSLTTISPATTVARIPVDLWSSLLPPPGKSAADYLREEQHDSYAGLDAALENAYLVGSVVVDELLANWERYRDTTPGSEAALPAADE